MRCFGNLINRTLVVAISLIAGSSLVTACSDEDEVSDGAACEAWALAEVDADVRCGSSSLTGALKNEVVARKAKGCEQSLAMRGTSLTAGQVQACADWKRAVSCATSAWLSDSCRMEAPGQLEDGDRCFSPTQCKSEYCGSTATTPAEQVTSCGFCAPVTPVGSPCSNATPCGMGSYCSGATGVCTFYPTFGQSCADSGYCVGGAVCRSSSQICGNFVENGGHCEDRHDCGESSSCIDSICQPRGQLGEDCSFGCVGFLDCVDGICQARSYSAPGEWCSYGEHVKCEYGTCSDAYYDEVGVCPLLAEDGSLCSDDDSGPLCKEGSVCLHNICTRVDPSVCH